MIQRVKKASVTIQDEVVGQIEQGLMVLLGIHHDDKMESVGAFADKIIKMRIFADEAGKMNRSLVDISGELLVVSQFTLYADCNSGRRPSFIQAARPEKAIPIYESFKDEVKKRLGKVASGQFGAEMAISLVNDGPVTIFLNSDF